MLHQINFKGFPVTWARIVFVAFWLLGSEALAALSIYKITDFGAIGDGQTLNTTAIQAAIDRAHADGRGVVLIPAGVFLSGSLWLKSGVELRLETGATLLGSPRRADYAKITWHALLLAKEQDNIALSGQGVIDGNGAALAADVVQLVKSGALIDPYWAHNRPHERERPQLIEFMRCRKVRVEGLTLRNSACWVQSYDRCDGLLIRRIRVESMAYWNNDGIDLIDSRNVLVRDCFINSADDGICLKSSWPPAFCDNIRIERCTIRSSASALKIGTASKSGFRNVRVRDLYVYDTYRSAIALEIVDGGFIENVDIARVRAVNTGNALFIRLGHRNQKGKPGAIRGIRIRDLDVQVPAGRPDAGYAFEGPPVEEPHNLFPASITGLPGHPVHDVRLENIRIRFAGGGRPETACVPLDSLDRVPERPADYPEFSMFGELPAWGLYVRHADGLSLKNVRLICEAPDFRPAIVADDAGSVRLEKLRIQQPHSAPLLVLRKAGLSLLKNTGIPPGQVRYLR
ncbi:MAG: glycoside hydrolase family 28 protein [Saprospiraceae bacterium]|nr:glycoside hydrolase family 28 protein [Saprospiraceae bacterium]